VRGNLLNRFTHWPDARSIPACAGESTATDTTTATTTVYPRVCGGISASRGCCRAAKGLSPRVRGNHARSSWSAWKERSIPACAGESPFRKAFTTFILVYPRVCGGIISSGNCCYRCYGLSPRVRGNHARSSWSARKNGSIPACAGESCESERRNKSVAVYPRVCGGISKNVLRLCISFGLSPRVRGNLYD